MNVAAINDPMPRNPENLLQACRAPQWLAPQSFGLWEIVRQEIPEALRASGLPYFPEDDWLDMTVLCRTTVATLHEAHGETVMEDSRRELSRHLPILLAAKGRVLVTGLGLGCVVRGLLSVPEVEHIDVVELDRGILDHIGAEFYGERVTLYHDDALAFPVNGRRWDFAWHDLWCEGRSAELCRLHLKVMHRFRKSCGRQGAWMFDRRLARVWPWGRLLGSRRRQ